MPEFQKASLTAYGASRILEAQAGEVMLFTSIGLGSGFLPLENLYNVTHLEDERQRFPISERTIDGDKFSASCHVTSIEHPAGIYLREMGLYIADKEYPNDPLKDRLFAVTSVGDDDPGGNYVVYLPKSSQFTLIDYTFTISTIISPSAEIIIKGLDSGTADYGLNIASLTVLGGLISSPAPGKVSVNQKTGEATANRLDEALSFIDSYTPYSLPVAAPDILGGLKSSSGEGHLSIDPETHEGVVNGYAGLRATVEGLAGAGFMSEITELRDHILSGAWLPKASLTEAGIVQLSSGLSQDTNTAVTPKIVDDLREQINTALTDLRDSLNAAFEGLSGTSESFTNFSNLLVSLSSGLSSLTASINNGSALPPASLDHPGIVQLSNEPSQDETLAITPKAVDDLRQTLESLIADITESLEDIAGQDPVELPEGIVTLGPDGKVPVDQLPDASLDNPGIVQLSSDISQDETLAPTLKAIDDLRQSLEENIAELTERLESMDGQGSGSGTTPTGIYGVRWFKTSSLTSLDRINDAAGLTFTPSVGSTSGSSSFDNIFPWSAIRRCVVVNGAVTAYEGDPGFSPTPTIGDVMVEIPAYYYKINDTVQSRDYLISDADPSVITTPPEGFQLSPRHSAMAGSPNGRSKIYVGAYTCNSAYRSISGNASVVSITRATMRTQCKARGTGYYLMDYAAFWTIALLYLVEVANWDSQRAIGQGVSSGSSQINTGDTDTVPWHTGSPVPADTRRGVKYRGMENLWGNIWQWTDGFNLNNPTIYVNTDPATYADDTAANYIALGYNQVATASASYISALGFDGNFPWAQAPIAVAGADGTYISDQAWTSTGWRVLELGGPWGSGSGGGLFAFSSYAASSLAGTSSGGRLLVLL